MKFARKIFIYIFISAALIISGMSITTLLWISNYHMQTIIRSEKELVRLVALKSEDYILRNDRMELYQFYQSIVKVDPFIEYIFAEKPSEILVHSFDTGVPKGLLRLGPLDNRSAVDIIPVEDNQGHMIYHLRIGIGDTPHSILHFGLSVLQIRAALKPLRNIVLFTGGFLLLTVPFALAWFISRFVSKPLYILSDGVMRIGMGELSHRMDISTGDEIEQLGQEVNRMAVNLEKLQSDMKAEIIERQKAQSQLAKQRELLNNILKNIPHNIFWKNKKSIYIGCNKAFSETIGLASPEDVIGKSDLDLPWKKTEAEYLSKMDKKVLTTADSIFDLEGTLTQADGQEKTVLISVVPLKDEKGLVFGILGIYYDITERKQIEETIKQTQKMEAIGTLAGGIAHDFNNILGSMMGYTELAIDIADPDSSVGDYLEQVLKSADRAKELVRQILTFSRKSQEERKPIPLDSIIQEEAKMLRSTLPSTIEINLHIEDNTGMVNADPTQMHQIVMNLCTNAAHVMQETGGVLEISLSSIIITHESQNRYQAVSPGPFIELKISDTGTGIDPKIIHRIFEPFFTTKEKEKGTGMGLAVVHGIVKDHGGEVLVDSHIGKGTTFTVLLPSVISKPGIKDDYITAIPTGCEQVLFVDDEKILSDLGEKTLISLGYKVKTLNDSLEALEVFQQSPDFFDIVITDHTMPHMTGLNLARHILKIKPSAYIILCTGYSDNITPEKVQSAGIKALLYKPISRKEFALAIRKVLDEQHPITAL